MRDHESLPPVDPNCYVDLAEMLADENLALRAENRGLRDDVTYCGEVITAAVRKLHEMHLEIRDVKARYHRALDDMRVLLAERRRRQVRTTSNLPDRAGKVVSTCHLPDRGDVATGCNLPALNTGKRYLRIPPTGDSSRPSTSCG